MAMRPSATARERIWSHLREKDEKGLLPLDGDGPPTDGTGGTGAGVAGTGCLYHDTTNGYIWVNEGTKASPVWGFLGTQVTT